MNSELPDNDNDTPKVEPGAEASQEEAEAQAEANAEPQEPVSEADGLRAELADVKDRFVRQVADTENLRKRLEREKQDAVRYALGPFAKDLLGVADNLTRAIEAVPDDQREAEGVKTLLEGVEMTERELAGVFERHNITRISPEGEAFNPNFHQAVAEVPMPDKKSGTVINVVQAGYLIADRLIRPAMVVVAKGGANGGDEGGGPGQSVDQSV